MLQHSPCHLTLRITLCHPTLSLGYPQGSCVPDADSTYRGGTMLPTGEVLCAPYIIDEEEIRRSREAAAGTKVVSAVCLGCLGFFLGAHTLTLGRARFVWMPSRSLGPHVRCPLLVPSCFTKLCQGNCGWCVRGTGEGGLKDTALVAALQGSSECVVCGGGGGGVGASHFLPLPLPLP